RFGLRLAFCDFVADAHAEQVAGRIHRLRPRRPGNGSRAVTQITRHRGVLRCAQLPGNLVSRHGSPQARSNRYTSVAHATHLSDSASPGCVTVSPRHSLPAFPSFMGPLADRADFVRIDDGIVAVDAEVVSIQRFRDVSSTRPEAATLGVDVPVAVPRDALAPV